jgi:hypothetical protein
MAPLERSETPHFYSVNPGNRAPLIAFMVKGLEEAGCRIIYEPPPNRAPFVFTFETPTGERTGIVAYAFLANNELTINRPENEHRFQIKYGGNLTGLHHVWQDPHGLYTTIFLGINPEQNFFVAADPALHDPTRFSVSVEFKDEDVGNILNRGWHAWERERRGGKPHARRKRIEAASGEEGDPLFEVLVGGTRKHFLQLIRFERESFRESPGDRQYIADHLGDGSLVSVRHGPLGALEPQEARLHALAREFELPADRVLDLIAERRMLKIAVRGSVAEEHLLAALTRVDGVRSCRRIADENGSDVELIFRNRRVIVECKNSSRMRTASGLMKIDFQRTRASKADPCSRYYSPADFDLVAACVHACTERWDFLYARTSSLEPRDDCPGKLDNNVKLDPGRWTDQAEAALNSLFA